VPRSRRRARWAFTDPSNYRKLPSGMAEGPFRVRAWIPTSPGRLLSGRDLVAGRIGQVVGVLQEISFFLFLSEHIESHRKNSHFAAPLAAARPSGRRGAAPCQDSKAAAVFRHGIENEEIRRWQRMQSVRLVAQQQPARSAACARKRVWGRLEGGPEAARRSIRMGGKSRS
jgi:hypothetical protein